jgi:hypothetical protein
VSPLDAGIGDHWFNSGGDWTVRMEGSMSPYAIKVGLFDGQKKGYPLSLSNQGRRNYHNQKKGR